MTENRFPDNGRIVELDGRHPLVLEGQDRVWLVESGRVDLFLVDGDPAGDSAGSRHHLLRQEEGRILWDLDAGESDPGLRILAVGSTGTRLREIPAGRLRDAGAGTDHAEAVARLLETWLESLAEAARVRLRPRNAHLLTPDTAIEVSAGEVVHAAGHTVWVVHPDAEFRFQGREDLSPVPSGTCFPVSAESWLEAAGAGEIRCLSTESVLRDRSAWPTVALFHRMILSCAAKNRDTARQSEKERLRRRSRKDQSTMNAALTRLAAVLSEKKTLLSPDETETNPLLAACRRIGKIIRIDMKPDPFGPEDGSESEDPVAGIARASGVRMRRVALRDDWWCRDNGPLLAFTRDHKHPVALIPRSPRAYLLYAAQESTGRPVDRELAQTLDPMAVMFYRPFPEGTLTPREFLRFGLRGCRQDITAIVLLGTAGALLGLVFPLLTGILMDSIIPEAAKGRLLQIFLILLSCALASALFDLTKKIALLRVETMSDISMQAALWDRLMSLPAAFFRRFSSGDLAMRSLGINTIRQIISGVTVNTILSSLFSIFNFVLLFYYDWEMALVALGLALIGISFAGVMGLRKVKHQRVMNEIQGKISGAVLQFITGIAKLRVSGTETRAFAEWARMFERQKRSAYRAGLIQGSIETFHATFPVLASMTIFAWMIFGEVSTLTTGDFVAFNAAYTSFQNALLQMAVALAASLNVVPLYERLEPILREPPEVDATRAHPGELTGAIEVNHVSFRYTESGPLVINDVSCTVRPGEFIALVGPSGSGKSTMLRLLLAFEDPESGSLYYDGQDLSTLDVREVRRQIGVVLQNARVMPGDIFKNIVGASNLTVDDAWEAARMAGLEEDIRSMPMGMNTMVSAGGETLSGGQRQRLLIARAIVKKPRILFFDEATSALDNKTQAVVSRCLEGLKSTRLIIAHRLSTVIHADRIIVMEGGRVVETGTYAELMEKNGVFAALAKRQLS